MATTFIPGRGLGAGISLRREFLPELSKRAEAGDPEVTNRIRWLEVMPENFIGRGGTVRRALLFLASKFPIAFHSVSLSLGSTDPLDRELLKEVKLLARETGAKWVTDHLSFASVGGAQFHNLLPMPFTQKSAKFFANRISQAQDILELPLGFENPSYYIRLPAPPGETEISEAEFISAVLEKSETFLLLDINNVFVNSVNHSGWKGGSFEPALKCAREFLDSIPLDRIREVHIAGHEETDVRGKPLLLDNHGASVRREVRALLKYLNEKQKISTLLLEREMNIPPLDDVLSEAHLLWRSVHPGTVPAFVQTPKTRTLLSGHSVQERSK